MNHDKEMPTRGDAIKRQRSNDNYSSAPKKSKIDYKPSGLLAAETNTKNGVVLKFALPLEARKPLRKWKLFMFKDSNESSKIITLATQTSFLIGKDVRVVDIPMLHPTVSKQHAVIVHRLIKQNIKPYIIDLESINGTFLNGEKIEASRFYELKEKDLLKFGRSSREFVVLADDMVDLDEEVSIEDLLQQRIVEKSVVREGRDVAAMRATLRDESYRVAFIEDQLSRGILESTLWPNFKATGEDWISCVVLLSHSLLLQQKVATDIIRENEISGLLYLSATAVRDYLARACETPETTIEEASACVLLLSLCFEALEVASVRNFVFKLAGLTSWYPLGDAVCETLIAENPSLRPHWIKVKSLFDRIQGNADSLNLQILKLSLNWFSDLVLRLLEMNRTQNLLDANIILVERILELLITAYSHLPIRRIIRPLCSSYQLLCQLHLGLVSKRASFFCDRLEELDGLFQEDLDNWTITSSLIETKPVERVTQLTRLAFSMGLEDLAAQPIHSLLDKNVLASHICKLEVSQLQELAFGLKILTPEQVAMLRQEDLSRADQDWKNNLLIPIISHNCTRIPSWPERINNTPILPNENSIWGTSFILNTDDRLQSVAIPRLGLQFLHLRDIFLRNFDLYRLEAFYELRQDVERAVIAMKPEFPQSTSVVFKGYHRMATEVQASSIVTIAAPAAGENIPTTVRAEISIDLTKFGKNVQDEWDTLKVGDHVFLLLFRNIPNSTISDIDIGEDFLSKYSILALRTAEVVDLLDEEGETVVQKENTYGDRAVGGYGTKRTLRILFDPLQYHQDMESIGRGELFDGFYGSFNLIVRRRPESNFFEGISRCLKSLLLKSSSTRLLDESLTDLIVGFGSETAAHPPLKIPAEAVSQDFGYTFQDPEHLQNCFPLASKITFDRPEHQSESSLPEPPYTLQFTLDKLAQPMIDHALWNFFPRREEIVARQSSESIWKMKNLNVRYTSAQIAGIRSGLGEGLTLIVGPPGTGKTDTAIQLVSILLQNNPNERILIIARSNVALNEFFTKVAQVGVHEKYLIRLGMGERELQVAQDEMEAELPRKEFSKRGRVNYILKLRQATLDRMKNLALALKLPEEITFDIDSEQAMNLWKDPIQSRIDLYNKLHAEAVKLTTNGGMSSLDAVLAISKEVTENVLWWRCMKQLDALLTWLNAPRLEKTAIIESTEIITVFPEHTGDLTIEMMDAETDFKERHLTKLQHGKFIEEMLGTKGKFGDRNISFADLFFIYHAYEDDPEFFSDCLSEEDAHKKACLYSEKLAGSFADLAEYRPFELLRSMADRSEYMISNFSKVIAMTSSHAAMSRDSLLDSEFKYHTLIVEEAAQILDIETIITMLLQRTPALKRVILLGDHRQLAPIVQNRVVAVRGNLQQSLFSRFIRLGVPYVQLDLQGRCRKSIADTFRWRYSPPLGDLPIVSSYSLANPGLAFTHQFIDCASGRESIQADKSYINEVEALWITAMFMYMRILNYPREKITVLASYRGQRDLIKQIMHQRCGSNPLIGFPSKITTIDKFQGQQNDYVLISMVRTQRLGYLSDPCRLTVAFSRARFGLYIFGSANLYRNIPSTTPFFSRLIADNPMKLAVLISERMGSSSFERKADDPVLPILIQNSDQLLSILKEMVEASAPTDFTQVSAADSSVEASRSPTSANPEE